MAIDLQASVPVTQKEQRTWRVNIEAPKGQDYVITAHREELWLDNAGKVLGCGSAAPEVKRRVMQDLVSKKEADFVCHDGTAISIAHLLEAIPGLIDRWAVADVAAAAQIVADAAQPAQPAS